eukprot:gene12987-8835_t
MSNHDATPYVEQPSLVEQFELGRLAAKDIIFPDRFYTIEPLNTSAALSTVDSPVDGCSKAESGGASAGTGATGAAGAAAPSSSQTYLQESSSSFRQCASCHGVHSVDPYESYYATRMAENYRRTRNVFLQRVQHRRTLQAECHQTVTFERPDAVVDHPWLVFDGEETEHRKQQETVRYVPHRQWAEAHKNYLERCAAHREECLKRLCKRKLDNIEVERYCKLAITNTSATPYVFIVASLFFGFTFVDLVYYLYELWRIEIIDEGLHIGPTPKGQPHQSTQNKNNNILGIMIYLPTDHEQIHFEFHVMQAKQPLDGVSGAISPKDINHKEKMELIDLTISSKHFYNHVFTVEKPERKLRVVRRGVRGNGEETEVEPGTAPQTQITYITGIRYYFQRFIRQHAVAALLVWSFLCLAELGMVILYLAQAQVEGEQTSWTNYDRNEWSSWFWARVILSCILFSQLLFAYSVSVYTVAIVILTTVYQLVLLCVAFTPGMSWVTKMYVPFFLRCWPMRQYFLFVLDSIAVMTPRNRRLDLMRLAAGPLTLFVCLVFTAASCFRIDQTFQGYPVNIAVAIYFIIVTVSTVGYGDVVPKTIEGKAIVIIVVFVFLSKMPTFIQVFRSAASIYKAYRSYTGRPDHFIVYGYLSYHDVMSTLDELLSLYPAKTIVFCNNSFPDDVISLSRNPNYQMRCTFLTVDALDTAAMQRLMAHKACGVVIFPIHEGHSSRADDDVMLASRIFKRHFPLLPQHIWLRYGLHSALLRKDSIIIEEHMKKCILATALLLPGIIPFLVNIIRTAWTGGVEPEDLWGPSGLWDWKNQYKYSRRQTIKSFESPIAFAGLSLRDVIIEMKRQDLLVVGVKGRFTNKLTLDLDHEMEQGDLLVIVFHPSHHKQLMLSHDIGDILGATENSEHIEFTPFPPQAGDLQGSISFYPFESGTDDCLQNTAPRESDETGFTPATLRDCLCTLQFTTKRPNGIPIEQLELDSTAVSILSELLRRHSNARNDPYCPRAESERLEDMINNKLVQLAYVSQNMDETPSNTGKKEIFIIVDLAASILRQTNTSVYEDIISQTIAQYQMYTMMRCISSIHSDSSAVLLTLRKYPKAFLHNWKQVFGAPLRYIRGQTSLVSHLNYALTTAADPTRIRGVLLYCSQMGVRDFGDVPVCSVETSLRELLAAYEEAQNSSWEHSEQHIVVELECSTSCMQVTPFHRDPEWLVRGKDNFQDALSFMMGRCFASDMVLTLPFHAHQDPCVLQFFSMTLQLASAAEMFEEATWTLPSHHSQTLFRLCGNKTSQFPTYKAAFDYLLIHQGLLAIGVFRLFPQKERLPGSPRYFITNPPLRAPLALHQKNLFPFLLQHFFFVESKLLFLVRECSGGVFFFFSGSYRIMCSAMYALFVELPRKDWTQIFSEIPLSCWPSFLFFVLEFLVLVLVSCVVIQRMAKVRYFDFDKNLWGDKRPSKESLHSPAKWTVSNTDFKDVDLGVDRLYESFCDFLSNSQPAVALLHCAPTLLSRIKSNKHVRKMYALIESRVNEDPTVALVQIGTPVEIHEAKENKALKTLLTFTAGTPKGSSLSFIVAAGDSGSGPQKVTEAPFPLKVSETDATILACNMLQGSSHRDSTLREICKAANYVDALEKAPERSDHSSLWSLWIRSTKYEVVNVERLGRRADQPRHALVTLAPSRSQPIDIPMPRSAKSAAARGAAPLLTDPAVLSAEVSKSPNNELLMLLKKNQNRWKLEHSFLLKGQDAKLTSQESIFDFTRFFNSPAEAVEQLNAVKDWPADFCVVHQTVLFSESVGTADRQAFRRYAKDNHKMMTNYLAALSTSGSNSNVSSASAWSQRQGAASDYTMLTRNPRQHAAETPREWSEASSIIIYQTTPREMKFNITHRVPVTKDALRQTILYLNKHPSIPQEKNPLYDYQYDYALLHSVEHQGYWLIAAKHVPCDIVACRMIV